MSIQQWHQTDDIQYSTVCTASICINYHPFYTILRRRCILRNVINGWIESTLKAPLNSVVFSCNFGFLGSSELNQSEGKMSEKLMSRFKWQGEGSTISCPLSK